MSGGAAWRQHLGAAVLSCVLGAAACSGASGPPPEPDFAASLPAQEGFAPLRLIWEQGGEAERLGLRDRLLEHVRVHASDPTARVARGMLAILALERNDVKVAEQEAKIVGASPTGTSADMARVALGGVERRAGRPRDALGVLRPLYGKVLDRVTDAVLVEELARAALEAGESKEAIAYIDAWLRQSKEAERAKILEEVDPLLARLSVEDLLAYLVAAREKEQLNTPFAKAVASAAAELVLEARDQRLARRLIEVAAAILGDDAEAVARVAARDAVVRLERNTVGVLLSLRTDEVRRRGIEATRGVAFAFGLPGSKLKMLSRDDQGDVAHVDEGLALLSADGASVLVAGLDTLSADVALAFAERTGMPMLLLRAPSRPIRPDASAFVVGPSEDEGREPLFAALLAMQKSRVAMLVGERSERAIVPSFRANVVAVQPCGAALEFLQIAKADGLVVDGGPDCLASDAVKDAPSTVYGIDASGRGRGLTSGIFTRGRADDLKRASDELGGLPLTFWTALGRDAGAIAKVAVADLEDATSGRAGDLAARKQKVVDKIAGASVPLWSTEAQGFGGRRKLPRTLTVEDAPR